MRVVGVESKYERKQVELGVGFKGRTGSTECRGGGVQSELKIACLAGREVGSRVVLSLVMAEGLIHVYTGPRTACRVLVL